MKIRNGFVSNSSSSSFIVLFPKEPKSAEDVKNMLFTKGETVYFYPYGDDSWNLDEVSNTVWNDICGQEKNNMKVAIDELSSGSIDGAPEYSDYDHITDWKLKSKAYNAGKKKFADKKLKEFFNLRKLKLQRINNDIIDGEVFYCFEYSDNDGDYYCALEHGDLFSNLKYIHISKH